MKLSYYISSRFIGAAILITLLSIPVSYFAIKKIMELNVDEGLEEMQAWLNPLIAHSQPELFNRYNNNISIEEVQSPAWTHNRFRTKEIYDSSDNEFVGVRMMDYYFEVNGKNYYITLRKSLIENEDILYSILSLQVGAFIFLLFTLFLINRKLKREVWKPFYTYLHWIKNYRVDKDEFTKLPDSSITELQDLSRAMETLTKINQQLFVAQKELTENTSHELQTPLAVIQNKLDLLMQTNPLSEQQMQHMLDLQKAIGKMVKLNKGLLLLSKIGNQQFSDLQSLSVSGCVTTTLNEWRDVFSSKNISVDVDDKQDSLIIANEILFQTLLNNLVSNAIKFTPKFGEVKFLLSAERLLICNTASDGALDQQLLFQRFKRQNGRIDGNGLGLEISGKIVNLYNWKLSYQYNDNMHCFELFFEKYLI